MPNFSAQPMRNAAGELVNPLTGETVHECAHRLHVEEAKRYLPADNPRDAARQRAERCAMSNMARQDVRLSEFYAAVAASLSDG